MTATLRNPFNLSAHLRPTIGDQKISYVSADHMGWVLCDGRLLSRDTYGLLFGVIGTTFNTGGEDSSNFRLPNPMGRAIGAAGQGSGLTLRAIGDSVGAETHTLTIAEMPTHNHDITDTGHTHDYRFPTQQNISSGGVSTDQVAEDNFASALTKTSSNSATGISINNKGGSNAHNNMQPTLFAGNMFIYSGRNMDAYFPYTWVGGTPASNGTAPTPGRVLIW